MRARAGACLLAVLAATAPGLAHAQPVPAPEAPAPAASATATAGATRTAYELTIEAPPALAELLWTYLDLARFRETGFSDGITLNELDRLIAAAGPQARDLLKTAGHFAAVVEVTRVPALPGTDGPPRVRVAVEPGPVAEVVAWQLVPTGEFETAREAGEPTAVRTWVGLLRDWPLRPGDRFTQAGWNATKDRVLAALRTQGYPAATLRESRAVVDAATHQVRLAVTVDSGELYRIGPVRIEGLSRYDESAVRNLMDFSAGTPYTEKRLLDLQERLVKVGLFDGATVEIDTSPETSQAAPVTVRVREATLQQATLGAGISANTGQRVSVEHIHRRPFGYDWIVRNRALLGRDERSWEGSGTSHPLRGQYRALVSGKVEWLDAGDSIQLSRQLRVGGSLDTERIERLFFGEVLDAEVRTAAGTTSASAVSGNYHLVWRAVDSVLLPTLGETANMQVGLGHAVSDTAPNGVFGRLYGRFVAYRPVGETWYFTGRLELGHVQARDAVVLPDTILFRAGGDESVRGYAYRTLGPVRNGVVSSGRSVATISVEMARPLLRDLPSVWGAVFVDGGQAADRWSDLKPVWGYGAGVRWRSPVGPLRVDVAWGEAVRKARLHVSVGIAF